MKSAVVIAVALVAIPAFAQRRVDIFFDVEGVKRTGRLSTFSPGTTRFEPSFQNGGGAGGGFNLFVSDRLSFEAKVAALTALKSEKTVKEAMRLGFHGYFTKDTNIQELGSSIRAIMGGEVVVPRKNGRRRDAGLSPQEQEVNQRADRLTPVHGVALLDIDDR